MYSRLITMAIGGSLVVSAGCATKRETGAAVGAVGGGTVGGLIGGSTGALIGVALGGLAGYGVGRAMEEEDRKQVAYALERNQSTSWTNPQTGYHYQVEPTRTVMQDGHQCRQFRVLGEVDGKPEEVYGTACRQPDGAWEVQRDTTAVR
jgi:surface antigen